MKLKISGKKEKLSIRQLTECALFLYVYFMVFSYTEYGHDLNLQYPNFFQIIRFACYFLCVVRIFLKDSYKKESFIVAIIAIGLCVLCAVTNGENLIFFYMLFLLAVNGCDSERIIKVCLYAQGIVLFVTTCLSMCGFIDNASVFTGGRLRQYLGFTWVTFAPGLFFFICVEIIYLKKGLVSWKLYIPLIVYAIVLYIQTKTRMLFFMNVLVLTYFLVFGKKLVKTDQEKIFRMLVITPWICAIISFVMVWLYGKGNRMMISLDLVINRLGLAYNGIQKYGIHLFGQPISWLGNSLYNIADWRYNYVDCSYVQTALNYGGLFLILVLMVYSIILYNSYTRGDFYLSIIIVFILVLCITESRLFDLSFNPFILLCSTKNFLNKKLEKIRNDEKQFCS